MKSAIVGCGIIAQLHASVINKMDGAQLVAVADIKKDRAVNFSKEYGGNPYDSLEKLIEAEQIDVLHICTPHYLHVPMAIYGLEHNMNVFMEKPPVISREQLKDLEEAISHSNKKLGLCFQNRYNDSIIAVKDMISSGETGKVLGARAFVTWNRPKEYYTQSNWRGKWATEGGGALINQAIHTLDLASGFLGTPVSVDANFSNHHLKGIIEVEDTLEAYIQFETAPLIFYCTTAYNFNSPTFIELECENITIRVEETEVTCIHKDGTRTYYSYPKKDMEGKSYYGAGHRDCINDYYNCLKEDKEFSLELKYVKNTILLMLDIYQSGKEKKTIEFHD